MYSTYALLSLTHISNLVCPPAQDIPLLINSTVLQIAQARNLGVSYPWLFYASSLYKFFTKANSEFNNFSPFALLSLIQSIIIVSDQGSTNHWPLLSISFMSTKIKTKVLTMAVLLFFHKVCQLQGSPYFYLAHLWAFKLTVLSTRAAVPSLISWLTS
jgi:hypothetical protein